MDKIYCGIDVGEKGFISVNNNGVWSHYAVPKIGKEVDYLAYAKLIREIADLGEVVFIVEKVHALFGSSAGATFSFGDINGFIRGLMYSNEIKHIYVPPKEWQKEMWQGITPVVNFKTAMNKNGKMVSRKIIDTKKTSTLAAQSLFPTIDFRRTPKCKNIDDNKVDSVLLCDYGRRKNF